MKYIRNRNTAIQLLDVIKRPIITDKTTKLLEENQYSFIVSTQSNKFIIKQAIEHIFNVKVQKVNTYYIPRRKKRVGKFIGITTKYKKAIIQLQTGDNINIFPES